MPVNDIKRDTVTLFKRCLRTIWPTVKSSHADEAIAAYYGFRTHAALLSALPDEASVHKVEPSPNALLARLEDLGYRVAASDLDRVIRLSHAEMLGRISENFHRMAGQTANDNTP